ncbi:MULTISPECIES: ribonuclease domain-containing protein [unclassified Streptomyces]|uniref:ribonuclease domain-containing protein n=1 Tax=unclassified Streptomyces TaxID=2593676 RepID=UPI000B874780|nr:MULTISPECIES: ribonuclease domain-containing protein [unclassified Streptomyces]MYZ37140.1 ribonuclease [Streptomyces sp. SID4917]
MRIPPRMATLGGVAALASALLVGGVTATATAAPSAVGSICYSRLPSQAHTTLRLIDAGGPFPYRQDGAVFQNREGILPSQSNGYYHEYTVVTPGSPDRGARRIVTGNRNNEDYYTSNHYASFSLVNYGC